MVRRDDWAVTNDDAVEKADPKGREGEAKGDPTVSRETRREPRLFPNKDQGACDCRGKRQNSKPCRIVSSSASRLLQHQSGRDRRERKDDGYEVRPTHGATETKRDAYSDT